MRRLSTGTLLLALAAIAMPVAAVPPQRSSAITVSATVVPYLVWNADEQPKTLRVTAEDIQRGFVDVEASPLQIRTNNRNGYLALFRLEPGFCAYATVTGFKDEFEVGQAGGFVTEPFVSIVSSRTLQYRLHLDGSARPGTYAFPLSLKVVARHQ